ncbi:prenyltransferase/squalene oxidase repeat-containing protein [Planctomicrobium sp. SH668]|uniref:prenyltransferase/squalene oxidase repeat-containing protein n=1 Tax=Planctomicrobium sp. SH668 TaxID=3448126 RepID=UPI003F5C0C3B
MQILSNDRIHDAYRKGAQTLLSEATSQGHWVGELSASALSTATAIAALSMAQRDERSRSEIYDRLIRNGIRWILQAQLEDGGWGDTVLSRSNISTSMLVRAAFSLANVESQFPESVAKLDRYLEAEGGVAAVKKRYGKDRTFSVPILTQCALAGRVDWNEVSALPFELGCLPHQFYKTVRLPVVSYALPALIAIGQLKHVKTPSWNPMLAAVREAARKPTLRLLEKIQPESGGFLEATPLTSFVSMSLLGIGLADHPVVRLGLKFIVDSVREDGSWPIDTNLATWVTTLSVNALHASDISDLQRNQIIDWLLAQQLKTIHPYTNAAPGGWAWTDLSGGVPDADDTPGAILALLQLSRGTSREEECLEATSRGIDWLLSLQNRNQGWPTFCRGWGALPFDRSSEDITAHALRALVVWSRSAQGTRFESAKRGKSIERAIDGGFQYLRSCQRPDGSWQPLWFGNQDAPDDINPVYGTSRVLLAFQERYGTTTPEMKAGEEWLLGQQNQDGGWGGMVGIPSSVEETSLALVSLLNSGNLRNSQLQLGLNWLIERIEGSPEILPATPIGFYFAKLWYYERLYPQIFAVAALRRTTELLQLGAPS